MLRFIIVALLLVSLVANVFLYRYSKDRYLAYCQLRLDPIGESSYQKSVEGKDVVIFGDSHAAKWKASLFDRSAMNLGIGGQTTQQLLYRVPFHVPDRGTKVLILLAGANDVKAASLLAHDSEPVIETAFKNVVSMIEVISAERFIVCTVPPLFYKPFKYNALDVDKMEKGRRVLNEKIRALKHSNVSVLDAHEIFMNQDDLKKYSSDGVHLNEVGYELLQGHLEEMLK